eukprot:scaffold116_cov334-Pavlova_lutheri.AAC.4
MPPPRFLGIPRPLLPRLGRRFPVFCSSFPPSRRGVSLRFVGSKSFCSYPVILCSNELDRNTKQTRLRRIEKRRTKQRRIDQLLYEVPGHVHVACRAVCSSNEWHRGGGHRSCQAQEREVYRGKFGEYQRSSPKAGRKLGLYPRRRQERSVFVGGV